MVLSCILQITSEHYYSCELTRKIPVRVSIITINGDSGFGIVEPLDGNEQSVKRYVAELEKSSSTKEVEVTYRSPEGYWTRVVHELNDPSIYDTILQSGCMSNLPIKVENGIQSHTVLYPSQEKLRNLMHLLKSRFTNVSIKNIRSTPVALSRVSLTKKQAEAFRLVFDSGYYSIPRQSHLSELCEKLGIKRVALQERLRRAELQIMSAYAKDLF
ncbi:MAG: helix-turn-helix domain-containing protein [Candidatus Thorarchaeota archaeon]